MRDNLLGFDVGSSSIKATLIRGKDGSVIASATSPETEMDIQAEKAGWAEQDPAVWWEHVVKAAREIGEQFPSEMKQAAAVGISYQMHGLVLVDGKGQVLRPSIIWCDSRAVPYGEKAFNDLGEKKCLQNLLNSPGNFTASKLAWVKENEPDLFGRIDKIMLPGDYIAYRMTGEICTTPSGLSEGILWNVTENGPAAFLMEYFGFSTGMLPEVRETFSSQGNISDSAASRLGIPAGIPVAYRAGDQPNNAFSLNVLQPGELAATAGTSGVVYGVAGSPVYDDFSRVNTFVHVNHQPAAAADRYGVLLCVNGTGILNRWIKQNCLTVEGTGLSYPRMNTLGEKAPVGAEGLVILPYGNGAERTLKNSNPGGSVHNLNFNIHTQSHLVRAAQEGIVFALKYGLDIMEQMGMEIKTVKAGEANMFLSPLFQEAFSTVTGTEVILYNTDGSQGAARGAGVGAGYYADFGEAFAGLEEKKRITPDRGREKDYQKAYETWLSVLRETVTR